jgi:predicted metal-dependent hydrolase
MQRLVQLALDLFDPPPAAAPAPVAPAVGVPDTKQKMPSAPDGKALVAPKTIVNRPAAPAVPLPSLLSPAEFRHPQANRELLLGDAVVAYALLRARRRSIGFTVGADGLSVRAPSWVTLGAVDSALREKSDWILRKLAEARERQQRMEGGRIVWANGAVLPYLGEPLTVVLDPSHGFAGKGGALVAASGHGNSLHIGLPQSASPTQIRDAVQAWLMRDARRHFTTRLDQRQVRRLHPPELAPAALPPGHHRLRGGTRTGPPARDGPQPALLGHGGHGGARLRAAAQPPARRPRPFVGLKKGL